jgi:flagellar basal-body rod modification protein FlgD
MQTVQAIASAASQNGTSASSVASALARPRAAEGETANSSSGMDSTTITANDFLTLLVAEMKNQDPTQPTDPNAYISQMVGVNSLQQLVGINQGVTILDAAIGTSSTGTTT